MPQISLVPSALAYNSGGTPRLYAVVLEFAGVKDEGRVETYIFHTEVPAKVLQAIAAAP